MAAPMTFQERWQGLPHAGGTAGPRTMKWMERTVQARPDCAYVGADAIVVALHAHERLVDLYMAARDPESLDRALASELPRLLAAVGPEPTVVVKGSEGHRLAPYGFQKIDELLYYFIEPVPAGASHPAIRRATLEDMDVLMEIDRAAFPRPFQRGRDEMGVHVTECSIVKVACEDGEVIGFTILQPLGDRYHLGAIGVRPDRQNLGWGRILFEESLHEAHLAGASGLGLTTQVGNTPSRVLYERIGMGSTPLGPVWARESQPT